jgi:hydrogenase large subunit
VTRLVVGPFNRVEGDLEVRLDVRDGAVASAEVSAPLYRGFETMLLSRDPLDALFIVPRICGICSVSQSVAAARALADLAGAAPPANGAHAINLMLACENLADHLAHFYLFFMPDFTRAAYAGRPWFDEVRRRFAASGGAHRAAAVAARQRWFMLMGTLGGKWPHTQSLAPGGSSRALDAAERSRLLARLSEFRAFVERQLYAAPLAEVAAIADWDAFQTWCDAAPGRGDLRFFAAVAADAGLHALGRGPGRALSWGAYAQPARPGAPAVPASSASAPGRGDAGPLFAPGVWCDGSAAGERAGIAPADADAVTEDHRRAWLADPDGGPRHPRAGLTQPDADKPGAYSWCKAPRLAGRVVETGALARQLADGQPLVADAARVLGCVVTTRVLARLLEFARVLPAMERWLRALVPGEPFHVECALPAAGSGVGLTEAARGALGHWIAVDGGRIAHWQLVAPTSWNFSPRDAAGNPGALEAALVGAPVAAGESTPVAVQHVVRSFDPCMVCTVH